MRDIAGEVRKNSLMTSSDGPLHEDVQELADQRELIYNSSVGKQDVV